MARPQKQGAEYFPVDVDIFSDTKIRSLLATEGLGGNHVLVYIDLLCRIYREGYYVMQTDDLITSTAYDLHLKENFIRGSIHILAKRSLFESKLLSEDNVLTSRGIQLRYQEIVRSRAQKRSIEVDGRYWVLKPSETCTFVKVRHKEDYSEKNGSYSTKNESYSKKNGSLSTIKEIKRNKRKRKEIKVNERLISRGRYRIMSSSEKILLLYRETCPCLPPVSQMGAKVRGYIREGIRSGYTIDDYRTLFGEVDKSKFLRGEAKNSTFRASFGWLVDPEHMAEVLRGDRRDFDYEDEQPKQSDTSSFSIDDFFEAAVRKSYGDVQIEKGLIK